ncbi:MAG: class I SAM-dependent methyltransferase [Bacillus sp. (in: firmicutes)]
MANNQYSMTAKISAFSRAYHSLHDEPKIFNDFLARKWLTDEEYAQISQYMANGIGFFNPEHASEFANQQKALEWVVQTQLAPTPLARARYCEEMLKNAIMFGAEQYVILGAGLDTFAFRHPKLLKKIDVYEVDHPFTQSFKKSKLREMEWEIPEKLHFVPMDFTKDNLVEVFKQTSFDEKKLSFFSWLGVTYYLSKEDILKTLKQIAEITPKGSTVVFDYGDEKLFDAKATTKRVQNMVAMAAQSGEPMKSCFSYSELEKLLEEAGFHIYEHLSPQDIEAKYFQKRRDYLHAFENIHYCLAVRQ